jgi:hypothetical protein
MFNKFPAYSAKVSTKMNKTFFPPSSMTESKLERFLIALVLGKFDI